MTIPTTTQENQAQATEKVSTKEQNFSQIRQQLEQERAARLQAEERVARLERETESTKRSAYSEDDDHSDEPYVDHRALEKKLRKWEAAIDEKIDRKAEEKARALVEQERRTNYLKQKVDFNNVMTPEMMQKLVDKDPELAETILEMPDGFARQKLVYHAIKAIGLDRKEESKPSIQEIVEKNKRSPYYQPSGTGTAPYAQNSDYSPSGQKNAYDKMQELKNRLRL